MSESDGTASLNAQPNPPAWPSSTVRVVDPSEDPIAVSLEIAERSRLLLDRGQGHFSRDRLAVLFKPGVYAVDVEVGYYTQVMGLGATPGDVVFSGERGVFCDCMDRREGGAGSLDTFWRSAENFERRGDMRWAVSQAAPLRRLHVTVDLELSEGAFYSSGGFIADSRVDGQLKMGTQQQFCCRNLALPGTSQSEIGGAWNLVFVGCDGTVEARDGLTDGPAVSVAKQTPVMCEKPFVTIDDDGKYSLRVPLPRVESTGTSWGSAADAGGAPRVVPFERVFVATAEAVSKVQAALDSGLDVVFSPGVYALDKTLALAKSDQVLLGLGMATLLQPTDGTPCLRVSGGGEGVRLAGLTLQATPRVPAAKSSKRPRLEEEASLLLDFGDGGAGDPANPAVLSDLFCRVGGDDAGEDNRAIAVSTMVRIRAGHVIGDNLWLWRADHSALAPGEIPRKGEVYHLVVKDECRCDTGLIVEGDDVAICGLAVEHTLGDNVVWSGARGRVWFYQNELPYDVDQSFGDGNFVGYRVSDDVEQHELVGAGVYTFFRDHVCRVATAFVAPSGLRHSNIFTRHLNGNGHLASVLNGRGGAVGPAPAAPIARLAGNEEPAEPK